MPRTPSAAGPDRPARPAKQPARRPAKKAAQRPPADPYAARPWLARYPAGVPTDLEVPDAPLTRLLDHAVGSHPSTVALRFLGQDMTYRELGASVDRFARALHRLGVRKGDRVGLVLPNCPQHVIAFFGALRAGAVVVENNPLYTEAELARQLADAGVSVVLCLDKVHATVAAAVKGLTRPDGTPVGVVVTSIVDYLPVMQRTLLRLPVGRLRRRRAELMAAVPAGVPTFLEVMRTAGGSSRSGPALEPELDPANDVALLLYTGGTTGAAKGAMLTHRNLVANALQTRSWLTNAQPGREVTLAVLPLFHVYGMTLCLTVTVLLSGTLVLLPRFDLERVFTAIDEHQPTLFPGVPPIYKAICDSPKVRQHDLGSIKACVSGAMRLPPETQDQFERITGGRLIEGYGMTETSPVTHANPLDGVRRPGSVGLPVPGTEAKIIDPERPERVMPAGEPGELAVRGPQVFRGYWTGPDGAPLTDGIFTPDGYLRTGDIAEMDAEGYFTVVGRSKELIIAGGFNVYPSEVEDVLRSHPGIEEACVIGVPDRYRGETVKAFVVAAPGRTLSADDVQSYCSERLTAYKVPRVVEFRSELPRSAVGKVLRRVLVDEELAALESAAGPAPRVTKKAAAKPAAKKAAKKAAKTPPVKRTPRGRS